MRMHHVHDRLQQRGAQQPDQSDVGAATLVADDDGNAGLLEERAKAVGVTQAEYPDGVPVGRLCDGQIGNDALQASVFK